MEIELRNRELADPVAVVCSTPDLAMRAANGGFFQAFNSPFDDVPSATFGSLTAAPRRPKFPRVPPEKQAFGGEFANSKTPTAHPVRIVFSFVIAHRPQRAQGPVQLPVSILQAVLNRGLGAGFCAKNPVVGARSSSIEAGSHARRFSILRLRETAECRTSTEPNWLAAAAACAAPAKLELGRAFVRRALSRAQAR